LKGDDVEYADFKAAIVQRFNDKQTDQYNYTRLQNASQERDESPEVYLDRLRKLCQRTVQQTGDPVEQAILNREADKRHLVACINGLRGVPGKQVRLQMPGTIDKALNMAKVAANAERAERDHERDERGPRQRVIAVGGNRGHFQGRTVWNHRNKSQEGSYRADWGRSIPSPRADAEEQGLAPSGLRVELLWEGAWHQVLDRLGVRPLQKGVRPQGRRTMTIVMRAATLRVSSVIIVGFTDITDENVEGDVRGVPVLNLTTQTG
jgi:hypothetical protein